MVFFLHIMKGMKYQVLDLYFVSCIARPMYLVLLILPDLIVISIVNQYDIIKIMNKFS